jgi:hypothetical protein
MSERSDKKLDGLPPHIQLIQMAGLTISRIVYAAAKLSLADYLATGSKSAEELAGCTGTHAPSLYRLLRALATVGILTEGDAHRFALTTLGEALRTGAPGAARASVLALAGDRAMRQWSELLYSLQTGKSAMEKCFGLSLFDWLARNPAEASLFSDAMINFHGAEAEAVSASYDFSGFKTIVDVGGASGHLLTTILGHCGGPQGILFDLPHVVRDAPELIEARGLSDRVTIQSGSFFDSVPSGADAYILSHIIHDWSEETCLKILARCREAMRPVSRLLLIEMVLPGADTPHPGKLLDITMLVGPGGQERTADEYAELLGKAGLRLMRVVPTASPASIVEAKIN